MDRDQWTQSSLATAAQVNRGVLNQLYKNQTGATPMLIGRLSAVLSKPDALRLITAYLDDILDEVATEAAVICEPEVLDRLTNRVHLSFPPDPPAGAV